MELYGYLVSGLITPNEHYLILKMIMKLSLETHLSYDQAHDHFSIEVGNIISGNSISMGTLSMLMLKVITTEDVQPILSIRDRYIERSPI